MGTFSSKNKNVKNLSTFISLKDKNGKTVLNAFIEIVNQINYGLTRENNFIINLCKNG